MNVEQIARVFKALSDPHRISIIKFLQKGEKCACHISDALSLSQSKLSYHMKILTDSTLIESWTLGKWTHYKINPTGREHIISILKEVTAESPIRQPLISEFCDD